MMAKQYVLTMNVITGDPHGLVIVTKDGWVGKTICFARNLTKEAERHGLDSPGVYFLLGAVKDSSSKQQIYVGEAEKISERLQTHQNDDTKGFWTRTIAFTSVDQSLNKADVKFIESALLSKPRNAGAWEIANTNNSNAASLSSADQIKVENFMETMLEILPVLGVDAFIPSVSRGLLRYFLSGLKATGEGEDQSSGFLVMKGALARKDETPTLGESSRRIRIGLLTDGILVDAGDNYRLTADHLFSSPSTAASVLLSSGANGRVEWKDRNGQTLKENQES